MAKPEIRSEGDAFREAFHQRMHANNMYGLWELASQMTPQPQPKMVPHMWPWSTTESIIEESARAVPVGDERRALQLFNPGLAGRWATTNNLIAAVQILLSGEVARAHRHTPTAIRFIIEGTGAYTAVDGERVYMAPGDLILTPSWRRCFFSFTPFRRCPPRVRQMRPNKCMATRTSRRLGSKKNRNHRRCYYILGHKPPKH